jgi:hypothetical protein
MKATSIRFHLVVESIRPDPKRHKYSTAPAAAAGVEGNEVR